MEPAEAALLAGEEACCHWIEGIAGVSFRRFQGVEIDGTCKVSSEAAILMAQRLNREHGFWSGPRPRERCICFGNREGLSERCCHCHAVMRQGRTLFQHASLRQGCKLFVIASNSRRLSGYSTHLVKAIK